VDEAKKFLKLMVRARHSPDDITYTSLMNGMCRRGNAIGARALLEEMQQSVCQPDGCTYNTLMRGLCMCQHFISGLDAV